MKNGFSIIKKPGEAGELNRGKAERENVNRLQPLHKETPREVADKENFETGAVGERARHSKFLKLGMSRIPLVFKQKNENSECYEENNFVKIDGVARNAVAKINSPGKRRRQAVCAVRQTCEVATESPDCQTEDERVSHQIARRSRDADDFFGDFHASQAAEQATHDGFVAHPNEQIESGKMFGILQNTQQMAAQQCTRRCADENPPAIVVADKVLTASALPHVELVAERVG